MIEKYLHHVWESKRISTLNLNTIKGEELNVISFGIRNENLAGPDFFFGRIRLNGDVLVGNIEIHVKSSDWYRHRHHEDSNYDNVILHVVYEFDREVIQNKRVIPTLEIKKFIDVLHYKNYRESRIRINKIICNTSCHELPGIYLESMKAKALEERYYDKYRNLISNYSAGNYEELLYILFSIAFGGDINQEGFKELVLRVPYDILKRTAVKRYQQLLIAESGLVNSRTDSREAKSVWNYKGSRPGGFPDIRVRQFAVIAGNFEFTHFIKHKNSQEISGLFYQFIQSCINSEDNLFQITLSKFMIDHLHINCLVPFLWISGEIENDQQKKEKAIDILKEMKAEKNSVTKRWEKAGIEVKSAYDSQALLSVFKYFCYRKKCLSCEVGNALLKNEENTKDHIVF